MNSNSPSAPRPSRRAAIIALVLVPSLLFGVAGAHADEDRSYPGCPLLLEGVADPCVEWLQADLNKVNDGYNLDVDGSFGAGTRIAVLDFQGQNGLGADGNVGGETADLLADQAGRSGANPPNPEVEQERPTGPVTTAEDPIGDEIELGCSVIPIFGGVCEYLLEADPAY